MYTKSYIFSSLFVGAIIIFFMNITSCSKDDKINDNSQQLHEPINFSKEIQLYDASGENSVIMQVSSKDTSLVAMYSADNFEIIPIKQGQTTSEAIKEYYGSTSQEVSSDYEQDSDGDFAENGTESSSISFEVISKDLSAETRNVAVTYVHPDDGDERAKWRYYDHYSFDDCVTITRVSFWRRVYVGVYCKKKSPYSSWSTITGAWYKLRNNEQHNKCEVGSYRLKARVKTKKSSAYTIEFDD
ncbi:MAG: hypothetical protein R6U95_01600 [Bacteroidales bacterium]